MTTLPIEIDAIEPRLLRRERGGWLAVSELGSPTTLGVEGNTVDQARERFAAAVRARRAILDEPE